MLYRHGALGRNGSAGGSAPLSRFADGEAVDSGALEAVSWAVGRGLLQGTGENLLDPAAVVSRAQEAVILHRYLGLA